MPDPGPDPVADPVGAPLRRIAVVGAGLVGGSVAAAARAAGAHVTLTDRDAQVRDRARELGLADVVADDLPAAVADADLVVAAVPAAAVAAVLVDVATHAPATAVLTDVASLKADVVPAVEAALRDAGLGPHRFLGGHPMAGSERSGPDAADATLFQGATWVLTPTATTDPQVLTRTGAALDRLGARVLTLAPELHDALVAVTSHLPQVVASTLAAVAGDAAESIGQAVLSVVGGGFRDTTRIAASDPELWLGILDGNRDAVVAAIDQLQAELTRVRDGLEHRDDAPVREVLTRASVARRALVREDGERPHADLVVALDDRPGALAAATTALGEAGVNVRDLAMRHADAGDRGALLVRVDAATVARAVEALAQVGLRAHVESRLGAEVDAAGPGATTAPSPSPSPSPSLSPADADAPAPGDGPVRRWPATRTIEPLTSPPDAVVEVPGSKSLTNRALLVAALADGTSHLTRVLDADDTQAMLAAWRSLGVRVDHDPAAATATVVGTAGVVPPGPAHVDARLSGTTARFLAPVLAAGQGPYTLDAGAPFRARPMGPTLTALRDLGARVDDLGEPGHLPVRIVGTADGPGGAVTLAVRGDASSQFLSGLLLAAPLHPDGLTVEVTTPLVSVPYVHLTLAVMRAFGAEVSWEADTFTVAPTGYTATDHDIEPDASAASYLLGAAAITGGRVRIPGLGHGALQGDVAFADVLGRMGAEVRRDATGLEVRGTGRLHGIEVDLADLSDTAQTLAAVAVFADGPTRITGIGFIRAKETDRIGAVVTELRRCGIEAHEEDDGLVVHPGTPQPATVATYDDHRMAMSFALLGLRVPGITLADPGCVAKTFPSFFEVLDQLRA